MTMLRVESINTYYGYSHILQDLSLEVKQGEIVVLLGRNGVGKTTTLKSIMGIQSPKSGRIIFRGEDVTGLPPHKMAQKGVALVPEDRRVIPNLSVSENLKMGMLIRAREINRKEMLNTVFAYFPVLEKRLNQRGDTLSGGEQQMLTIARAMVSKPSLMMIDEPTEGLMPILIPEIANIIVRLQQDGVTILLVEQNYQMSLSLSEDERAYILEKGQIRMSGTPQELQASQVEVEKLLGVKI